MNKAFKALSDPTRRKILELLKEKDLSAGEISDNFDISKPSISHHLSVLNNADLVLRAKEGQNVIYSLNTTAFNDIVKWAFDFLEGGELDENK